ncbi:hypothetical protein LOAG_00506 [Loa loa]|uniref:Uncharacterized protein n=1 Tax=Loa loa TaxID=7209 RepID=A0A1S0UBB7_LOALO|nr:hypothetical protein LOAG_00506 [Loa loa]EFO27966.1 hypothetical protein LOAG_00506 [Loa loa]
MISSLNSGIDCISNDHAYSTTTKQLKRLITIKVPKPLDPIIQRVSLFRARYGALNKSIAQVKKEEEEEEEERKEKLSADKGKHPHRHMDKYYKLYRKGGKLCFPFVIHIANDMEVQLAKGV